MNNQVRPLHLQAALARMRTGSCLVHMHSKVKTARTWFVVPGGEVTDAVAAEIRERPDVVGGEDGLFPNCGQTWKMLNFVF
jgi:hypothetical protein